MKEMLLKITGTQKRPGNPEEVIEFMTMSRIYQKGESVYVVYEETELSGMEGNTTTIRLTGNCAKMMRFGSDKEQTASLCFEKGKKSEGFFRTPMGRIGMEVETKDMESDLSAEDGGHVRITYGMDLLGVFEAENRLDIEVIGGKDNGKENC